MTNKKTGLFAGSFDPPTLGHQEMIYRAAGFCDKLYVAVADGDRKHETPISVIERISLLKILTDSLENVEVITFQGLVVDCAKQYHVDFLIRGLRSSVDLNYEMQMGSANKQMTGIETLCLMSSPIYSQINSSLIRIIARGGKKLAGFVPPEIERKVFELLNK